MPPIVVTSAGAEVLTVEQAKTHLRVLHGDLDTEVEAQIKAARDYCERTAERTFRTTTTRTLKLDEWWCEDYWLPYPPIIAVSSVTYYDEDNASQTLSSAEYHVEVSTDAGGRIIWASDAEIPNLYLRPDAVTITYTAGYASAAVVPPVAIQAMKAKLTELFGVGSENELKAASQCADRLLNRVDWTGYA